MTWRRDLLLVVALVAAPLAWFVQLTVGWALVPPAHHGGREITLTVISAVCLAVALGAAVIGYLRVRELPSVTGDASLTGVRLLAVAALVVGAGMALLVICTALPIWMLGAGAEP
jgi:hypothetical protein